VTTTPVLDLYEIAYLAGGVPRLVDTALVAMVESGRIRVSAPGQLIVADAGRRHPVEAAVLDAVGTRGHRSVDVIRWRLAGDERVLTVGRRLLAIGLVSRWSTLLRRAERPPLLTATGRRALRSLITHPPEDRALDGGTAAQVSLHGRTRLSDELRVSIFEPFPVPTAKERAAALQRRIDASRTGGFIGRQSPGGPVGTGGAG
jgi:hypothetical protein